jgi:hypothetical protein
MMQAAVHYQQNFSSNDGDEDRPWLLQDGIRWLDLMVRTPNNLPALQGRGADRQLYLRQRLLLDPLQCRKSWSVWITHDPMILAFAVTVVTGTTALAAHIPARRASRVNPIGALKYE